MVIDQQAAKQTLTRIERRQTVGMWVGGSFATLGIVAILGMLKNYDGNKSNAIGGAITVVLMLGLGGRAWWTNYRRLPSTRRALLFLTQACRSTLHLNMLTVQLQQLSIQVPLKDKQAIALAQTALPAASR